MMDLCYMVPLALCYASSTDSVQNKLVDSLEFLSAFAILSGMTPEEKIRC
jgi:hypothetical protein